MKTKYWILLFLAPGVILLDVLTKALVLERFQLHEMLPMIPGFFDLTYIRNTGAAFGFLAQAHPMIRVPFFLSIPIIALGVIGYLYRKLPPQSVLLPMAYSLVISGAIGNWIDRVRFGYVVDFLYFHWKEVYYFPAFNVADSAICVGVGLLMVDMLFIHKGMEATGDVSHSA